MKNIQEKLEAISFDLDIIIKSLHDIIREKQKYYHLKILKLSDFKQEYDVVKIKNMSSTIEHL